MIYNGHTGSGTPWEPRLSSKEQSSPLKVSFFWKYFVCCHFSHARAKGVGVLHCRLHVLLLFTSTQAEDLDHPQQTGHFEQTPGAGARASSATGTQLPRRTLVLVLNEAVNLSRTRCSAWICALSLPTKAPSAILPPVVCRPGDGLMGKS